MSFQNGTDMVVVSLEEEVKELRRQLAEEKEKSDDLKEDMLMVTEKLHKYEVGEIRILAIIPPKLNKNEEERLTCSMCLKNSKR